MPELTAAERGAAGPGHTFGDGRWAETVAAAAARRRVDALRVWDCCLCNASGLGGREGAHRHYMSHHYAEPLEVPA